MRYLVDIFPVLCTDDERARGSLGSLWYCRIERYGQGRREPVADAYGPSREDAWLKARDHQRYVRDMMRMH